MATKTWNGSDGAFSTNESWTPQFAPVSGDVAVINAGSVSATGSLPASLVINLNSSTNLNSTLALSNATLPISAQLNVVAGGTDAALTVSGIVTNKGKITATGTSPGAASLRIDNAPGSGATSFVNSGSIQVSDTGLGVLAGNNPGNQFENDGLISIHSPSRTPQLAVMAANLVGTGTVVLGPYVTFDAVQAVSAAQTFVFEHGSGGTTTLRMDAKKLFGAAISGFTASSMIQLNSGRWDKASYASTGASSGLLTLSLNGTLAMSIPFKGSYSISSFKLQEAAPNGSSQASTTIIVDDPLFNAAYYLSHNPDVAAAGVDPYQHFMAYGWKEGRNPNAFFDLTYYRSQNPDVAAGGGNLLSHFEQYGWKEGREPSLVFSDAKYLATYSDVKAANLNPLLHFQQYGISEGRTSFLIGGTAMADLLVDPAYYDAQLGATIIPTGVPGQQQAAWSYNTSGAQRGLNPDAFFDTRYYLTQSPDVKASGMNPLTHFEQYGAIEGRDPSLLFPTANILQQTRT